MQYAQECLSKATVSYVEAVDIKTGEVIFPVEQG